MGASLCSEDASSLQLLTQCLVAEYGGRPLEPAPGDLQIYSCNEINTLLPDATTGREEKVEAGISQTGYSSTPLRLKFSSKYLEFLYVNCGEVNFNPKVSRGKLKI